MFTKTVRNVGLFKQPIFLHSIAFSVPSTVVAALLKLFDTRDAFLDSILPIKDVFTSFTATVSLLLVFRSVKALGIYQEGTRGVHQMAGSWYDSASTLISFCRSSTASREAVAEFKATLVRLFSLLNMLCLVELEDAEAEHKSKVLGFTTIDVEGLDHDTLRQIRDADGKAEVVCQDIQCLVVDSIGTGVLSIPPPILSRSFQDLGNGMLKFHETLHLSRSPVPITLLVVTEFLLLVNAMFSPFMLALWTKGPITAAIFTFVNNFVFFTLNSLAGEIENPFNGDFNDIDIRRLHNDLNIRMTELVDYSTAKAPSASVFRQSVDIHNIDPMDTETRFSHHRASDRFQRSEHYPERNKRLADVDLWLERLLSGSQSGETHLHRDQAEPRESYSSNKCSQSSGRMLVDHVDEAHALPNEASLPRATGGASTPPRTLEVVYESPRGDYESNAPSFFQSEIIVL